MRHQRSLVDDFQNEIFYIWTTCLVFAIFILWYNERKAAINSFRLQHARSCCVSITPFQESNGNELVHVSGQLVTDELVSDTEFGVSQINCIKLQRVVEMYQWKKGDKQQEQSWVDHYVESEFGYSNDKSKLIVSPHQFINKSVQLGQYDVPEELKKQLNSQMEVVKLNQANITIVKQQFKDRGFKQFTLQNDAIYFNQVENQIINGDLRISFKYSPCGDATIMAKAIANTFVTWQFNDQLNATVQKNYDDRESTDTLRPIKEIFWIFNELLTAEECFSKYVAEKSLYLWILRGVAYILMAVGQLTVFIRLRSLLGIKDFEGISYILFNLAAAVPLTLFSSSFAWIYYRRKIGIGIFLASLALGAGVYYYAYKRS